ncbi:carboxymuconolactone decarboxylase family protein [Nonomuraea soli]|uniref:AhpD family alkylhydroperoxidase n=1 Tax=Nonomuraea soli TaxID=1032476 RepID=A0A7W0CIU5_9ACTN|nr:carboxymuconolactone decarboxylase family protein [Nonomuraea soli]MBA2891854.1 AhpD family alkylhydroperoxidase [Nonomuraea soli]
MQARLKSSGGPEVTQAIQRLYKAIASAGVDSRLLTLVHLRASQINGCGPCVFASVRSGKRDGETDERLHSVAAWRETPFFTDDERAALALTEAATRIQDGAPGVTDEIWEGVAGRFSEEELNAIILEIALTNFFNRINHTIREQAGKSW